MAPFSATAGHAVLATDIHIVMVPTPGGPVPVPLPHPFTGTLDGALSNSVTIAGQPAAVVGSTASNGPAHLPTPPGASFQKPPANRGTVMLGSSSVLIGGKPAARHGDVCLTCNDPADAPMGSIIAAGAVMIA
jgi:uncharacterized Zn-binding protein involved in type VI secretion